MCMQDRSVATNPLRSCTIPASTNQSAFTAHQKITLLRRRTPTPSVQSVAVKIPSRKESRIYVCIGKKKFCAKKSFLREKLNFKL